MTFGRRPINFWAWQLYLSFSIEKGETLRLIAKTGISAAVYGLPAESALRRLASVNELVRRKKLISQSLGKFFYADQRR